MTDVLGLRRTNTTVSLKTIASFTGSTNTKEAYKEFFRDLSKIGVAADMINRKKRQILDILKPQNTADRSQVSDISIEN